MYTMAFFSFYFKIYVFHGCFLCAILTKMRCHIIKRMSAKDGKKFSKEFNVYFCCFCFVLLLYQNKIGQEYKYLGLSKISRWIRALSAEHRTIRIASVNINIFNSHIYTKKHFFIHFIRCLFL